MEKKGNSSKENSRYIPEGAHTITPYLVVDGASEFIDFAKKVFKAEVTNNTKADDGKVINANLNIGDSSLMVSDLMEGMKVENTMLYIYVKDVDATYEKAIDAGAKNLDKVKDQFYGDRAGAITDAWGNKWWIATHKEDLSDSELEKRARQQLTKDMSKSKRETVDA